MSNTGATIDLVSPTGEDDGDESNSPCGPDGNCAPACAPCGVQQCGPDVKCAPACAPCGVQRCGPDVKCAPACAPCGVQRCSPDLPPEEPY
jgi:hypothetical protein